MQNIKVEYNKLNLTIKIVELINIAKCVCS